jgi:hypothetical protein
VIEAAGPGRRQPPQVQREDLDKQDSEPETRHRLTHDGKRREGEVGQPILPERADQPPCHAEHDGKAERHRDQFDRRAEAEPDRGHRRPAELQGSAEIAAQEIAQIDEELDGQRLVEMEPRGQRRDLLRRAIDVEEDIDRVSGKAENDKGGADDDEERQRDERKAPHDIGQHRAVFLLPPLSGKARGRSLT